jgi:two-component system chemotaxis response regulator CheY
MRRVLVIDDHQPSLRHLVTILHNCGYEVAGEGANSQNALKLVRSAAPDVVLMAVGLPDVSTASRLLAI